MEPDIKKKSIAKACDGCYSLSEPYNRIVCLIRILVVTTLISLILTLFPSPNCIYSIELFLSKYISAAALANTVNTAGLLSVLITWLITRSEDKICGARIVDLIEAKYPQFFKQQFARFLFLALCCSLFGNVGLFWPTLHASVGVLLFMCLLIRVCYIFAIQATEREKAAFQYYEKMYENTDNISEMESIMLHAAEYTRKSLLTDHKTSTAENFLKLWLNALNFGLSTEDWVLSSKSHSLQQHYCSNSSDLVLDGVQLSKKIWLSLMGIDAQWCVQKQIILTILETDAFRNVNPGRHRIALLTGLTSAILSTCEYPKYLIERVGSLNSQHLQNWIIPELYCTALMTLTVLWLFDPPGLIFDITNEDINHAAFDLWPQIHTVVNCCDKQSFSKPRDLLLYTEWFVRREIDFSLVLYSIMAIDVFSDDDPLIFLDDREYRSTMLACLYLKALYERGEKNRKDK